MKKSITYIFYLTIAAYQSVLFADNDSCQFIDSNNYDTVFVELKSKGMQTSEALCLASRDIGYIGGEIDAILMDFVDYYETFVLQTFKESDFPGMQSFLDRTRNYLLAEPNYKVLTDFRVDRAEGDEGDGVTEGATVFYYSDMNTNRVVISPSKTETCKAIVSDKNCLKLFQDLATALNAYRQSYVRSATGLNLINLGNIQKKWDKFINQSRSQTFLDVLMTSYIHRDYYKQNKLVAPASTQYFLFHPSVVYEHLNDAARGSRDEVALSLELFGVNWWDKKVPFGASVGWVYSDRSNASSIGKSLMLHFKNQYSIGYSWRDEEDGGDGIFLSVDLLKFFEDKKQVLEGYKSYFKSD